MQIETSMLENVDTYTLGRVISKMPSRHAMYSKIIHKQLNTMSVNAKWTGAENKCPVCLNEKEDWWHPLVCQSPDMIRVRDKLMNDLEANLEFFKTYPPLAAFILKYFRNLHLHEKPEEPGIIERNYMVEFYNAFENQGRIGWGNFCRGLVSRNWRFLQHCYFLEIKTRDMYAVDKWTRMLIRSILEMNRILWKERCTILHLENESTYEERQRDGIWQFCLHLRKNMHLVPRADRHFIWKPQCFFYRQSITGVLNWEKRMRMSIVVLAEKGTHDIRRYLTAKDNTPINMRKRKLQDSEKSSDEGEKKLKQTNMDKYLLGGHSDRICGDGDCTQMRIERKRIVCSDDILQERTKRMRYRKNYVDTDVHSSVEKIVRLKRNVASPNMLYTRKKLDITSGRYCKHP